MFEYPPWNRGCDNCRWHNPEDKTLEDCQHADLEKNEAGVTMNCKAWEPKKEQDKEQADARPTCSLNPDPHGSCWTCPIDCQRWRSAMNLDSKPSDVAKLAQERQARVQALALDRGVQQGHTLEALDTVFDIACQQVPSCKERWMILKEHIQGMLLNKWIKENEDCFRAEY